MSYHVNPVAASRLTFSGTIVPLGLTAVASQGEALTYDTTLAALATTYRAWGNGEANPPSSAFTLGTTTEATASNDEDSPSLLFVANGWTTDGAGAPMVTQSAIWLRAIAGSTSVSSQIMFGFKHGDGAWAAPHYLNSGGAAFSALTCSGNISIGGGTQTPQNNYFRIFHLLTASGGSATPAFPNMPAAAGGTWVWVAASLDTTPGWLPMLT